MAKKLAMRLSAKDLASLMFRLDAQTGGAINPKEFVHVLRWHPKPRSHAEMQQLMQQAAQRRQLTLKAVQVRVLEIQRSQALEPFDDDDDDGEDDVDLDLAVLQRPQHPPAPAATRAPAPLGADAGAGARRRRGGSGSRWWSATTCGGAPRWVPSCTRSSATPPPSPPRSAPAPPRAPHPAPPAAEQESETETLPLQAPGAYDPLSAGDLGRVVGRGKRALPGRPVSDSVTWAGSAATSRGATVGPPPAPPPRRPSPSKSPYSIRFFGAPARPGDASRPGPAPRPGSARSTLSLSASRPSRPTSGRPT
jgi:hypothetical protein